MILEASGLRKTLGGRAVVHDVGFRVEPGCILGLLGPNGAGKTTTFRMVAGLIEPDGGQVTLGAGASRVRWRSGFGPGSATCLSGPPCSRA